MAQIDSKKFIAGVRKDATDNHHKRHRDGNAPSTAAQGDTRKFWKPHSIAPDKTHVKSVVRKDDSVEGVSADNNIRRKAGIELSSNDKSEGWRSYGPLYVGRNRKK